MATGRSNIVPFRGGRSTTTETRNDRLHSPANTDLAPKLTIIQLNETLPAERDWIRSLLEGTELSWISSPNFSQVQPGALYCYYGIKGLELPEAFLSEVSKLKGCGLLHLGDEYYRGDYRVYSNFDYVIRNSAAPMLKSKGIFQFPIGYSNDLRPHSARLIPASQRKHVWSFAGSMRHSRAVMAAKLKSITPFLLSLPDVSAGEKHISREDYLTSLSESAFVPCGPGNIILETLRPYEALEFGAIPLLPRRRRCDLYSYLLGKDHPLPSFTSWDRAAKFVTALKKDPARLDDLQARCTDWWKAYKLELSSDMQAFVAAGSKGIFRDVHRSHFGNWSRRVHVPRRALDLFNQQSATQITARINALPNRFIKRLKGESIDGVWALSEREQQTPSAQTRASSNRTNDTAS